MQPTETSNNLDTKFQGQVFTPDWMVILMLDHCQYHGAGILRRHVIDNSCGEGAFLIPIVRRYIEAAQQAGLSHAAIRRHLVSFIHGIEKDPDVLARCISGLNDFVYKYGYRNIPWDIRLADALTVDAYDGQMHYVIGNPPYVRIHNVPHEGCPLRTYRFTDKFNADLYIAFFELGIRMLNTRGRLCYITPVSWLYSVSGRVMRRYLTDNLILTDLVDMGHTQVFPGINTYTFITSLACDHASGSFRYHTFDDATRSIVSRHDLQLSEAMVDGRLYVGDDDTLAMIRSVKRNDIPVRLRVRNGLGTLADKVFIGSQVPDSPYTVQAYKASTGQWYPCFYPYDSQARPIPESQVLAHKGLSDYLLGCKPTLLDRDIRHDGWWLYGRTQALTDTYKPRMAVNMLLRDERDVKTAFIGPGQVVYSGYYVTSEESGYLDRIPELLTSPVFASYVRALGKYKSGGYYTFNALDLEQFLNYHIHQIITP